MGVVGRVGEHLVHHHDELEAGQALGHPVRVRRLVHRVAAVDEHHADGRLLGFEQPAAEQGLRDRAMMRGAVGRLHRLVEVPLGVVAVRDAAARHPDVAAEGTEGVHAPEHLRAVLVLVEAPPEEDGRGSGGRVLPRELPDRVFRQLARGGQLGERAGVEQGAVLREAVRVPLEVPAVLEALLEDDLGHGHRELRVGGHARLHVLVAEVRRLAPHRVDQDDAAAALPDLLEDRHGVEVGGHRVTAPEQHEPAVQHVGRVVARAHAEVERLAGPRGAAAERAAGGRHAAQQVPEAPAQELGGAPRAGALVVHDGQRARVGHVAADLLRHQVERLVPADPIPAAVGPPVAPLERMELPLRAVDTLRESVGLAAEIALGELVIGMALELHDAAVLHVRDDPAAIRAVQRARGVDRLFHPRRLSLSGMTGGPGGAGASRGGPAPSTSRTRVRARGQAPPP